MHQGRSQAFESEGAQSPKAILGPFRLKKCRAQVCFYFCMAKKVGSPGPPGSLGDYGPEGFLDARGSLGEKEVRERPNLQKSRTGGGKLWT